MSTIRDRRPTHDNQAADALAEGDATDSPQRHGAVQRTAGPLPAVDPHVGHDSPVAMHKGDHDAPRKAPTAGPSEDDRFGEGPVANDAQGRILGVSVVGGRTRIMIGLGQKQGIHLGMEGYVKAGDGMLADFQIEEVRERTSYAFVETTVDGLADHHQVVVNPTSRPKSSEPQKDMSARIVGLSIEGGQTKLMIGRGVRHGARAGMKGYIIGNNGHPFATFEVVEQHAGYCTAFVHHTIDALREHTQVILNPASMP